MGNTEIDKAYLGVSNYNSLFYRMTNNTYLLPLLSKFFWRIEAVQQLPNNQQIIFPAQI